MDVEKQDRLTSLDDDKKRIIDFSETVLPVPITGIYDDPVRYYKANKSWAVIIEGFVSWLADVAAWKEAQNQSYEPIQNILTFLEGVTLSEEISCDIIEACLETSSILATMQALIDANTATNETQQDEIDEMQENPSDGSTYPAYPAQATTDACNAAHYITEQFRLFIVDLEASLDEEATIQDVAAAFFGLHPKLLAESLKDLIQDVFGDPFSNIPTYNANAHKFIDFFHCTSLDKEQFALFLDGLGLFDIGRILDIVPKNVWDNWVFLGSLGASEACDSCQDPDEFPSCVNWAQMSGSNWNITFQYIGTVEENAVVDNSFGNGAPSAKAGFITSGSNHGRYINVRVTFDEPMRVQSASMQYWYQDDGNDSPRRRISLFDSSGTALANQQLDTSGAPKSAWTNHEWTGDVSGVAYIEFNFRHWGTNTAIYNAASMSAFLDNICMEVEPDGSIVRLEGYGNAEMSSHAVPAFDWAAAPYLATPDIYRADFAGTGTSAGWDVRYTFAVPTLITSIDWKMVVHRTSGGGYAASNLYLDGVSVDEIEHTETVDPVEQHAEWTGSQTVTEIRLAGGVPTSAVNVGGGDIMRLVIGLG